MYCLCAMLLTARRGFVHAYCQTIALHCYFTSALLHAAEWFETPGVPRPGVSIYLLPGKICGSFWPPHLRHKGTLNKVRYYPVAIWSHLIRIAAWWAANSCTCMYLLHRFWKCIYLFLVCFGFVIMRCLEVWSCCKVHWRVTHDLGLGNNTCRVIKLDHGRSRWTRGKQVK
jgi:hypothetical protein